MSASHAHDDHHDGPHVTPLPVYFGVFGALLVLTVVTVWIAQFDFGAANTAIAMLVATVKATLVAAIFMHLMYDERMNLLAFVFGLLFVSLFFIFTMLDVFTRKHIEPVRGNHAMAQAEVDELRLEVEKAKKVEPAPIYGDEAAVPADERSFVPPPPPPAPVTEAPKAQLSYRVVGKQVKLAGQVASLEVRQKIADAAKAAAGGDAIDDVIQVEGSVATPAWFDEVSALFGALGEVRGLSISASATGVIVDGRVETEAAKTKANATITGKVTSIPVSNRLIVKAAADEAKERLEAIEKSTVGNDLFFQPGTDVVNDNAKVALTEVANLMHSIDSLKIEVGAHVDAAGNAGKALSQKQAEAIRAAIVAQGVDGKRVSAKGYGNSKPVAGAPAEQQRRIEFSPR